MARTIDQARWRKSANAKGKRRVELWLPDEVVAELDALQAEQALSGRAAAIKWLLDERRHALPVEKPRQRPAKRYRLRRLRAGAPGGTHDAEAILINGVRIGRVWRDGKQWIAALDRGLYPHHYHAPTRAAAVERMLACEMLAH